MPPLAFVLVAMLGLAGCTAPILGGPPPSGPVGAPAAGLPPAIGDATSPPDFDAIRPDPFL